MQAENLFLVSCKFVIAASELLLMIEKECLIVYDF